VRLLAAAVSVVREDGYGGMSVSRITSRASVSRRTFYDLFEDREDCFLAVFDEAVKRASRAADTAYGAAAGGGWRERVRAGLGSLLGFCDGEPALGSLLVVDALAAGPRVLERRAQVLEGLARIVDEGRVSVEDDSGSNGGRRRRRSRGTPPPPSLAAEGAVGAVLSVIHARMLTPGPTPLLGSLLNELMGMIVLPYLGPAAAEEELKHRTPRGPRTHKPVADPLDDLPMRLTYRTLRVLAAIASHPGASNRRIGELAGTHDQGQISKLLARLEHIDLIHNTGHGQPRGEPNSWTLTPTGREIEQAIQTRTST
jgi:AcrR family transcriptional regulator